MANKNLTKAKSAKNDEFYTRLEDIEKERLANDIRHLLYNLYLELYTEPTDAENEEITYGRVDEFYAYLGYNLESEDLLQQLNIQSTSDLMTLLETF